MVDILKFDGFFAAKFDILTPRWLPTSGVGKAFKLYRHQNDQLKQIVLGLWKKFYTEKWVLTDVNFDIAKGERVGIVGHNGAGKTTLLQMLCGITQPTRGFFDVRGRIAPILALGSAFDSPCALTPAAWWRASPSPSARTRTPTY